MLHVASDDSSKIDESGLARRPSSRATDPKLPTELRKSRFGRGHLRHGKVLEILRPVHMRRAVRADTEARRLD
jgi:hypothetical protein